MQNALTVVFIHNKKVHRVIHKPTREFVEIDTMGLTPWMHDVEVPIHDITSDDFILYLLRLARGMLNFAAEKGL